MKAIAFRWPFPVVAKVKGGRRMYVDLRSAVSRGVYVKGEFDPAVFEAIQRGLRKDGVFLDIGANVGIYSVQALDFLGQGGAVHAFEIDPRPLKCLLKTKERFGYENLLVHRTAIGATRGNVQLVRAADSGTSQVGGSTLGLTVPMVSLDEWSHGFGLGRVDVIKIDVEGYEMEVLRGAREVVERFHPLMVIEADDSLLCRCGASVDDLERFLSSLGYKVETVPNTWSPTMIARYQS
jgi:FkbM family methyltransferase